MAGEATSDLVFSCPECGQRIEVNDAMREAIIANGCPVCSAEVAADRFEP